MGNPSDGFRGKTLSFLLANFMAEVTLILHASSADITIIEEAVFSSLNQLQKLSIVQGYHGGLRLLQATCKVFFDLVENAQVSIQSHGFELHFRSNIPRMVGLSGSSALVTATFRVLQRHYNLSLADLGLNQHSFPDVLLRIEQEELGIRAGLQDRVIQAFGGVVHMNFTDPESKTYTPIDPALLPCFYLVYNIAAGGESGQVHSTVRERWANGDQEVIEAMSKLAALADQAVQVLEERDYTALASLMDSNFNIRRRLYGDAVVGEGNLAVVEMARRNDMGAKFCGSGGAIICLPRHTNGVWLSEENEDRMKNEFMKLHYAFERIQIAPPVSEI
jgi:glucuronokinase